MLYLITEDYLIDWEKESIKMSKTKTARKLFHLNKLSIVVWILIVPVQYFSECIIEIKNNEY